ncbi:MAG: ABC transporter substrate-binding protein [Candidatus Riflebacteria bacterium]|nr:ABC transporter substrate-binding protein [Candidatus Riflebacteria bacterium]
MSRSWRFTYPTIAVVIVLFVLFFGFRGRSNRLVVGVIGPLTGNASGYGIAHKNGIRLAVDQINAVGGINGRKIEAIFLDDANDKILSAEAGRDLLYKHNAIAIIGAITSDNTMNLQRLCERARVPLLTAVSTNPFITRVNFSFSFRCLADDTVQAQELARYTSRTLNLHRVAILHDMNKYGSAGARTYRQMATGFGQEIVLNEGFDNGTTNFRSQLEKVRASNPDGLLIWGLYRESALALRQAREMGINVPAFGGDGMALPDFLAIAGPAAENTVLTFPFDPVRGGERAKKFLDEYRKAFSMEADSFAAHGYDAMMLLARAITTSNATGPGIRDALSRIGPYEGIVGKGGLDETGNETRPVQLARVQAGNFVPMIEGDRR